jgi:hypothetical protein
MSSLRKCWELNNTFLKFSLFLMFWQDYYDKWFELFFLYQNLLLHIDQLSNGLSLEDLLRFDRKLVYFTFFTPINGEDLTILFLKRAFHNFITFLFQRGLIRLPEFISRSPLILISISLQEYFFLVI